MIRELSSNDIPKIVELIWDQDNYSSLEEAWRQEGSWCCTELAKDYFQAFKKYGKIFVYEEDGEILGFIEMVSTKTYDSTVYLNYIEVKSSERKRGIGKKLVEYVSDYYKKRGYNQIIVVPSEEAKGFYEKCGFKKWKKYVVYLEDISNRKFDWKEYKVERKKLKKEDILGKEIKSYVTNISEQILIWQNKRLKFTFQEKDLYGYINGKPFYIKIAYERANIFVWDLNILNFAIQEAKIAGATEVKVVTWKEKELDFEKDYEWFYMIKDLY